MQSRGEVILIMSSCRFPHPQILKKGSHPPVCKQQAYILKLGLLDSYFLFIDSRKREAFQGLIESALTRAGAKIKLGS